MGKPRMIILIRHAQSEGNKNRDIHQSIPDHRVKLTPLGWTQAHAAGLKLRSLLRPDDTIQFFTSPYTRTRETTQGILSTLCSDDPSPSPFPLQNIKVYEEPRLREQDFGNFQPCSAEMERMWQERADYGHFFYRIPNGESAADAYDRVAGFNESLWRQFGEDDCASVCVLVTHGLMSRVFLMKWYHFSVEYFEDLRNVDHCEFLIMRKEESGKYNLETKLRTWSGLKRERALALKEKAEKDMKDGKVSKDKDPMPLSSPQLAEMATGPKPGDLAPISPASPAIPKRKKWGGCPNGCDHGRFHYKKENSMHSMKTNGGLMSSSPVESPPIRRHFTSHFGSSSDEDEADPRGIPDELKAKARNGETESIDAQLASTLKPKHGTGKSGMERNLHKLTITPASGSPSPAPPSDTTDSSSASPSNPPQYVTRSGVKTSSQRAERGSGNGNGAGMLHVGRDFGGTASGRGSGQSDTETDVDAEMKRKAEKAVWRERRREKREGREGGYAGMAVSGMGERAKADGLGDLGGEESSPELGGEEGSVLCTHESHSMEQVESEDERGGSVTERGEMPGQGQDALVDAPEEVSPGSVQSVHLAVKDLGILKEASVSAEFDVEGKNELETEEDRHEKSVAGQVR